MKLQLSLLGFILFSMCGLAMSADDITTKTVEYKSGDLVFEGYAAYPADAESKAGALPAVLIVHQWKGLTDYERMRAEMLAKEGFVAFALDIYGKGVRAKDSGEAGKLAGQYKGDRALLRERAQAGLAALQSLKLADPKKTFAIGYCFGGTTVLEMARAGAEVAGVVSFHGGLDAPVRAKAGEVKSRILILHGADDPFVPAADIRATEEEFRACGADWSLVSFGGAVHSFTDKGAGNDNSKGAAYNEKADARSWEMMMGFISEAVE